ncbi:MAG TPA: hypothetical protein PK951_12225 [Chitinophagaceae bacterium]|nr:hypothetical protein [Chitinophagaceae bacterium]
MRGEVKTVLVSGFPDGIFNSDTPRLHQGYGGQAVSRLSTNTASPPTPSPQGEGASARYNKNLLGNNISSNPVSNIHHPVNTASPPTPSPQGEGAGVRNNKNLLGNNISSNPVSNIQYPISSIQHQASSIPTTQAGINELSITSLFFPFNLMAPRGRVV